MHRDTFSCTGRTRTNIYPYQVLSIRTLRLYCSKTQGGRGGDANDAGCTVLYCTCNHNYALLVQFLQYTKMVIHLFVHVHVTANCIVLSNENYCSHVFKRTLSFDQEQDSHISSISPPNLQDGKT